MTVLVQKFKEYHDKNPQVFEMFKRFSQEAKQAGFKKFSAKAVFERMRWYTDIETKGEPFKLSNNYHAYYARKLMEEVPEFDGFFRTKMIQGVD